MPPTLFRSRAGLIGATVWLAGMTSGSLPARADTAYEAGASSTRRSPHDVATELFEVELGLAFVGRRFSYGDPVSTNIRDYRVFGAPMPEIALALYPGANGRTPFVRDLGLIAHGGHALGLGSTTSDGTSVDTSYDRLGFGLRERWRPGPPGVVLGLSGEFTVTRFAFDATTDLAAQAPSVSYDGLRAGLDARLGAGPLAVTLAFGYDGALGAGDVASRFRDTRLGGVDFALGLAIPFGRGFEGRLRADYTRYFYTFHPVVGDTYVAGGALDEMFGVNLLVAYAY